VNPRERLGTDVNAVYGRTKTAFTRVGTGLVGGLQPSAGQPRAAAVDTGHRPWGCKRRLLPHRGSVRSRSRSRYALFNLM